MADIKFVPICSECGKEVLDILDYQVPVINIEAVDGIIWEAPDPQIHPTGCKCCGALFNHIIIPTKFPYDNRRKLTKGPEE